jgi:hypothetical protein
LALVLIWLSADETSGRWSALRLALDSLDDVSGQEFIFFEEKIG